jgi:hypothetical protein
VSTHAFENDTEPLRHSAVGLEKIEPWPSLFGLKREVPLDCRKFTVFSILVQLIELNATTDVAKFLRGDEHHFLSPTSSKKRN